jgi:hypothetical protein
MVSKNKLLFTNIIKPTLFSIERKKYLNFLNKEGAPGNLKT